jgi:phosphoglycolate phosphatase
MVMRASAVIIDLDGTLLDTAADLAAAANLMRADLGLSAMPLEQVASYVGKGVEILVHRVLGESMDARVDAGSHARAHASFLRHYASENGRHAQPYPGVREGLEAMRGKGLRLACVTNKPAAFTEPLLERSGLASYFELVVSGDTLPRKKPDPMPMLHVAQRFGLQPSRVVAIGDSINDAQSARAAGMAVLAVPYGYNEGRDVRSLDTDGIVATLLEAAMRIEP